MPDIERILQNTPGTIKQQWYEDGAAVDPGTVTLGITRADGTVLIAAGAATAGTGTNPRTFNLSAGNTALLDTLKVTWTSSLKGTLVSYLEVVGGFLFTIAQAQALAAGATTAQIADARIYAETELEHALGYALVPRYKLTTTYVNTWDGPRVMPFLRTIRSAINGTTTLTADDIALLVPNRGGLAGYRWSNERTVIGYEHGLDAPPPGASQAALSVALGQLGADQSGSIDPRATSIVTVDGTVNLRAAFGQFSAVGVNEWVAANRLPCIA